MMFKNYLTVAFRNLKRHKQYSAINIIGLAVGMTCCFLILLFVVDALSYDTRHPNADRLYRVINGNGAKTAPILAPTMKEHLPEVEQVVRLMKEYRALVGYGDLHDYESRLYWADANVFEVFHLPLLKGDSKTALVEPNTMVMTEAMVEKYFGDVDPIGQVIHLGKRQTFRVTGVLKDEQVRSHVRLDFLVSASGRKGQLMTEWFFSDAYTYVVLKQNVGAAHFQTALLDFVNMYADRHASRNFAIQSVLDIHLHSYLTDEAEVNGDVRYLYLFGSISVLILLIACINFVNLSTARSAYRVREVGARKVLGARRWQLVGQFLGESVTVSLMAFVVALSLFEMLLNVFNVLFETSLSVLVVSRSWALFGGVGIALLVGVIAGSYSAFFLSSFSPIQAVRGTLKSGWMNALLRQGLVVFQFAISITLMVCTAIVYFQLDYIQAKNLGFDKDQVLEIDNTRVLNQSRFDAFRNTLRTYPNILQVSTGTLPGTVTSKNIYTQEDGSVVTSHAYSVDYNYFETMGIELVSGRIFSRDHQTDQDALIVNQTYLDKFPERKADNIIGVVKDFHALSLHQEMDPVEMRLNADWRGNTLVRFGTGDVRDMMAFIEQAWKTFVPNQPFVYTFLDDHLDQLYRAEQKLGRIFFVFSGIAIFVACLGLFGLVAFTAERRTKEIGIRKVVGASVGGIVMLLSRDFVKLVVLANVIAWPVAYWAMRDWLANFAYRIDLGWEVFVLSGGLALVIALLTVGYQAWKAARANPVDALRYE
jgi:putative ABC transport system permease protein